MKLEERDPCNEVAELADCFVGWKVELVSDKLGYLADEISKKMLKARPSFSLLLIVKCERIEIN